VLGAPYLTIVNFSIAGRELEAVVFLARFSGRGEKKFAEV